MVGLVGRMTKKSACLLVESHSRETGAGEGRDYLVFAHRARTRLTIPSNSSWGISKRSETRSQSQRERCSCPLASRVTTTGASHLMHFPSRTTNIIVFLSSLGGRPPGSLTLLNAINVDAIHRS